MRKSLPENWENIRKDVLTRDGYKCINCKASSNLHVHHIHQKYFGGSHNLSNLVTLCEKCHSNQHIEFQISLTRKSFEFISYNFRRFISLFLTQNTPVINYPLLLRLITGHSNFFKGQREIIDTILSGENVLVIRPTGSGKSLIYQLPALISEKPSIVICPLKALMKDQVEKLWKRNIPVTFINSDISQKEKRERIKLFQKNAFKLLYLAPERFDTNLILNNDEINELTRVKIKYLIIDEAHNIEDWGYSFRANYRKIGRIRELYQNPQVIASTATATPYVRSEIINSLGINNAKIFLQGFDRPNIIMHVLKVRNRNVRYEFDDKLKVILKLLKNIDSSKKTIIYVPTIKIGEKLLSELTWETLFDPQKYIVEFFHGGLDSQKKSFIQNRFTGLDKKHELDLLISTNAFGMGIDISNIRYVIHWTQPKSLNSYYQEIGRAGRDNNPSLAILLKLKGDESIINFMMEKTFESSNLPSDQKANRYRIEKEELENMINYSQPDKCLRKYIHDYFGSDFTSPKKSFIKRLLFVIFNIRSKNIKYCCTNCDKLYKDHKLRRVIKLVNKF